MAVDVKASLRQEIDRLRRAIAEKTSELASLNDGLRRDERALALLGDRAVGARTNQVKTRRPALVSWDTVFKNSTLPNHRAQRFQNGGNCAPPIEKISSSFSEVTR